MHALFIKLTSMGDLIHALPAITDAAQAIPGITFDWVIDKNFSEVALWHPAVKKIIPTQHRYWRKHIGASLKSGEIRQFLSSLRAEKYDLVIDGQTSMKSAIVTRLSRGPRHGLDRNSARESWIAPLAYQHHYFVNKNLHAIERLRLLFASALGYARPETPPDYGISEYAFPALTLHLPKPYLVFVHNASWPSKRWPETSWRRLIELAQASGFHVLLPWGNAAEKARADNICRGFAQAQVLPFCSLSTHAQILRESNGAICSDTGLCHLAAALNVPSVTLYGSTDPQLIGATGQHQQHLMSPFPCTRCYQYECYYGNQKNPDALCFLAIKPEWVWHVFRAHLNEKKL
jgi:lipopolysaccharide heptosyltransferase I